MRNCCNGKRSFEPLRSTIELDVRGIEILLIGLAYRDLRGGE
jgi:hypothetical protein